MFSYLFHLDIIYIKPSQIVGSDDLSLHLTETTVLSRY